MANRFLESESHEVVASRDGDKPLAANGSYHNDGPAGSHCPNASLRRKERMALAG
jgi:hypothetical protein